ncbi:MAG: hypothetical protein KME26_29305 [Oscillatoria princeps RMCB-10]|nr:hypothetical protein [Oscillatoria princeps RMCB-10]
MAGEAHLKCGISVRLNRSQYACCPWGCALRGERVACFELSDRHLTGSGRQHRLTIPCRCAASCADSAVVALAFRLPQSVLFGRC